MRKIIPALLSAAMALQPVAGSAAPYMRVDPGNPLSGDTQSSPKPATKRLVATAPASQYVHSNQSRTLAAPSATGGDGAITWTADGLVAGMTASPSTGAVSVTNPAAGTYAVTLHAKDADGAQSDAPLSITVAAPLSATAPAGFSTHADLRASSGPATASNALDGVTWTAEAASTGITVDAASGTVTADHATVGSHPVTLLATDGTGETAATAPVTITVSAALSASTPAGLTTHSDLTASTAAPTVDGANGTVSWRFASGSQPAGGTLSSGTGVVTFDHVGPGTYAFSLTAADAAGATANTGTVTATVLPPLSVTTPTGVTSHAGIDVATAAPAASNASGAVTFSPGSGGLPQGATLDASTGVIHTAAAAAGTYSLALSASDNAGDTASTGQVALTVLAPMTAIAPADVATHANLTATSTAPSASNASGTVTWSVASGVANGIAVASDTGIVTVSGVAAGTYKVALKATDQAGGSATTAQFTVTVSAEMTASAPANLATHSNLTAATAAPAAQGAGGTVTWSLAPGAQVAGITVDPTSGVVTATNVAAGTYTLSLVATDQAGATATTPSFAVTVLEPLSATAQAGVTTHSDLTARTAAPVATAAYGTTSWTVATGALPSGLTLDKSVGALTATNVAAGTYTLTLTVADQAGATATTGPVTVTVLPVLTATAPAGIQAHANQKVSSAVPGASNASGTVSWSAAGTPPSGVSVDATSGVITADHVATGSYPVSLVARDDAGDSATSGPVTIQVADVLVATAPANLLTHSDLTAPTTAPTVSNATGTVSWSPYTGALPSNVSLDGTNGVLTFANAAPGTYTLGLTASDSTGATAKTGQFTVTVSPPLAATAPANLATHSNLTASTATPVATNVAGTPTWLLASGALGTGMALNRQTGVVTATNAMAGTYALSLSVSDQGGATARTESFTVTVSAAMSATAPASLSTHSNMTASTAAPSTANASGNVVWTVASGTLPTGMTLAASTGVITAANAVAGSYAFTLQATDQAGATANTGSFTVSVSAPLTAVAPANLSTDANLTASTAAPTTSNQVGAVTWALASGTLPAGLVLDGPTGILKATNVAAGTYTFTLAATDAASGTATTGAANVPATTDQFSVIVGTALAATAPANLQTHADLTASTAAPVTTGGSGTVSWALASGTLPPGMTLDGPSGILKAANVAAGTYPFTLRATDAVGGTATTAQFTVTVSAPMAATAPKKLNAIVGTSSNVAAPTATNATGTVTYALTSGSPPTGMSFSTTTGAFSGTPTASGSFPVTVTVADAAGGSVPVKFTVYSAPTAATVYATGFNDCSDSYCTGLFYEAVGANNGKNTIGITAGGTQEIDFPQPVAFDGSLSTDVSGLTLQVDSGDGSTQNLVTPTTSNPVVASKAYLVNNTGADLTPSSIRLGYGNSFPAYLPSGTAGLITPAPGKAASISLLNLLQVVNTSGPLTWNVYNGAVSGGVSTSGNFPGNLSMGTNGRVTGTPSYAPESYVYVQVTDARGFPSGPIIVVVEIQSTTTAATARPTGSNCSACLTAAYDGNASTSYTLSAGSYLELDYGQPTSFDGSLSITPAGGSVAVYVLDTLTNQYALPSTTNPLTGTTAIIYNYGSTSINVTTSEAGYGGKYP